MPCYRCSARQTDPVRGASPWRRGVVRGEQVLICPDCRALPDWDAELDRCAACGSAELVKRLGLVVCRSCGHEAGGPGDGAAAALERTLGALRDARPER